MRCLPVALALLSVGGAKGFSVSSRGGNIKRTNSVVLYNSYLDQLSAHTAYNQGTRKQQQLQQDQEANDGIVTIAIPAAAPATTVNEATPTTKMNVPAPAATATINAPAPAPAPVPPPPAVVVVPPPPAEASSTVDPAITAINGWVPDTNKPLCGLPGAIPPLGYFDPLGFGLDMTSVNNAKLMREAEVVHGRVAMLAVLGYAAGENFPGPFHLTGPAVHQLDQLPKLPFAILTVCVTVLELYRATVGWEFPDVRKPNKTLFTLRQTYYPGDIGFDPFGFKPRDPVEFEEVATKELSNGRLAMIAITLMTLEELATNKPIFA